MIKAALFAKGSAIIAAIFLMFLLFSYLFFPTAKIDNLISQVLSQQGLTLSPSTHKTILPGLAWDNLTLSSEQGSLFRSERVHIRPLLLPLLIGKGVISAGADIGSKGSIDIKYALNGKSALRLAADDIQLSDIPFFKTVLGAKAGGTLWSQGSLQRGSKGLGGEIKLEVKQLQFSGVKLGAFSLPDVDKLKTQGMIKVTEGKARLESFTLEGDGVYMRLSGDIPSGANVATTPLNMILEIMPKPEFLEKQKLVFMLLIKFMASPGVYKVPIKGTLLKPEIL